MFRRKIYNRLLSWKQDSNGHTALLIEGARRVGKTTLVKEFAKREYDSYILIDFSKAPLSVRKLFDDMSDLNYFFLQLQMIYNTKLTERKSLIVFDEVQLCPSARQSIKHLVRDYRYDYIETGSLISIHRNVKDILIPSEETKITMNPMDYEEFLEATGDSVTSGLIQECFENGLSINEHTNRKLMRSFRLYMLIGGMPQAVSEYIATNNFKQVDAIKRGILKLYEDDFARIDRTGRLALLFDNIPAQLNQNGSRYHVSAVLPNYRAGEILELVAQLRDSGTVLVSYHTADPNVGLTSTIDLTKFKLFLSDTGLFTTLMFKDRDFTENIIYEKLLSDKLSANLGYLYKNVVAQMLTAKGDRLFYHTFRNEGNNRSFEIDFLISRQHKICPVEVKSSGYLKHSSLNAFCSKFSSRILRKYLINTKAPTKDQDVECIPPYMVPFL